MMNANEEQIYVLDYRLTHAHSRTLRTTIS